MLQVKQFEGSKEFTLEDHQNIVNNLNSKDGLWTAKVYDHMIGKTWEKINRAAGRKRFYQKGSKINRSSFV